MNNVAHMKPRSPAIEDLQARFDRLEEMVRNLGKALHANPPPPAPTTLENKRHRVEQTKQLLAQRGSLVVHDLRAELGVSVKTATRLMHAVSHAKAGVLLFEPVGHVDRLRLVHPDKAVIEAAGN